MPSRCRRAGSAPLRPRALGRPRRTSGRGPSRADRGPPPPGSALGHDGRRTTHRPSRSQGRRTGRRGRARAAAVPIFLPRLSAAPASRGRRPCVSAPSASCGSAPPSARARPANHRPASSRRISPAFVSMTRKPWSEWAITRSASPSLTAPWSRVRPVHATLAHTRNPSAGGQAARTRASTRRSAAAPAVSERS